MEQKKYLQEAINDINSALIIEKPSWALLRDDYYRMGQFSIRKWDLIALTVIPLTFLIFNIVYWAHYFNIEATVLLDDKRFQ